MADLGYIPDQVVGYAANGASRYLACWTRDPTRYPATGLPDASLEAVDDALEQFLIDQRIPSATVAVYRAKNDRLLLSRGYGFEDYETRKPIGPRKAMEVSNFGQAARRGRRPSPNSSRDHRRRCGVVRVRLA